MDGGSEEKSVIAENSSIARVIKPEEFEKCGEEEEEEEEGFVCFFWRFLWSGLSCCQN